MIGVFVEAPIRVARHIEEYFKTYPYVNNLTMSFNYNQIVRTLLQINGFRMKRVEEVNDGEIDTFYVYADLLGELDYTIGKYKALRECTVHFIANVGEFFKYYIQDDIYEEAGPAPVLENPNLLFNKVVKVEPGVSGLDDLVQAEDDSSLSSLFRRESGGRGGPSFLQNQSYERHSDTSSELRVEKKTLKEMQYKCRKCNSVVRYHSRFNHTAIHYEKMRWICKYDQCAFSCQQRANIEAHVHRAHKARNRKFGFEDNWDEEDRQKVEVMMSEEKIHKIYVEVPDRSAQRVEKYIKSLPSVVHLAISKSFGELGKSLLRLVGLRITRNRSFRFSYTDICFMYVEFTEDEKWNMSLVKVLEPFNALYVTDMRMLFRNYLDLPPLTAAYMSNGAEEMRRYTLREWISGIAEHKPEMRPEQIPEPESLFKYASTRDEIYDIINGNWNSNREAEEKKSEIAALGGPCSSKTENILKNGNGETNKDEEPMAKKIRLEIESKRSPSPVKAVYEKRFNDNDVVKCKVCHKVMKYLSRFAHSARHVPKTRYECEVGGCGFKNMHLQIINNHLALKHNGEGDYKDVWLDDDKKMYISLLTKGWILNEEQEKP
ncbi:hypothetical protein WR25_11787 [Diploscapter pachys]|uniref:C2H2-type domain-containing protein n=1 Tax=Diploscapter pachys TaxID=2018661 RepID=A0A2A2J9H9_9BILA|nr:hypothetical protein WR25_11787 [Diploscapter pachys]